MYKGSSLASIIPSHNKQVLKPRIENYGCKSRKKERCPLDNKCFTPSIIYEAESTNNTNDEHKKYIDEAETLFKERCSNYLRDFKHKNI